MYTGYIGISFLIGLIRNISYYRNMDFILLCLDHPLVVLVTLKFEAVSVKRTYH